MDSKKKRKNCLPVIGYWKRNQEHISGSLHYTFVIWEFLSFYAFLCLRIHILAAFVIWEFLSYYAIEFLCLRCNYEISYLKTSSTMSSAVAISKHVCSKTTINLISLLLGNNDLTWLLENFYRINKSLRCSYVVVVKKQASKDYIRLLTFLPWQI